MHHEDFLAETYYVDFTSQIIEDKAEELFDGITDPIVKTKLAYEFVRDEIPHTFDIKSDIITARASDVLEKRTGICHAKANLLTALLRSQGIPAGFGFQRLTLMDDDSRGYCVHCYNAVHLGSHWVKLDARGNTNGINAQFSLTIPQLAFANRPEYDEYYWDGIYARPHKAAMDMLQAANSLQDVLGNIPDCVTDLPDIL